MGATLIGATLIGATLLAALIGATLCALLALGATPGFFCFFNTSSTIEADEGATFGFSSFFGGSCATNGAALGATPGFLSFGAALGSATGGP